MKKNKLKLKMNSADVLSFYNELNSLGIQIWVDGGWGVDALLGEQTRPHNDLDIAVQWKDVPKLHELLASKGYRQIREDNQWNFVLVDDKGHEIDIHAFIYDDKGNVVEGIMYPADSLTGTGIIDGQTVKCIAAEYVVKFHSGYEFKDKDFKDVVAICEKFNIDLPEEYARFKQK